jgi:microsomal prostaglandin-E synthase 2
LYYRYQLKDDVRESLYDACNQWTKNIGKNKFSGGETPNLADLVREK